MPALIIGVDPGKSGGIVPLNSKGDPQAAIPMPRIRGKRGGLTDQIDWPYLRIMMTAFSRQGRWIVSMEDLAHVTGDMPGRGKSMGTQIGEFHILRDAIESAGIPIRTVHSQTWQAAFGLTKGLYTRPAGASDTLSDKAKRAATRMRREIKEQRMFAWADNEWPWAAEKFGENWNDGTVAAAMIGRHEYVILKEADA